MVLIQLTHSGGFCVEGASFAGECNKNISLVNKHYWGAHCSFWHNTREERNITRSFFFFLSPSRVPRVASRTSTSALITPVLRAIKAFANANLSFT